MKIYDLIVENLILFFSSLGVATLFALDSLIKTLDGGVSTFLSPSFSVPLQNSSLVVSSSFFSSLALLELGFCGY